MTAESAGVFVSDPGLLRSIKHTKEIHLAAVGEGLL